MVRATWTHACIWLQQRLPKSAGTAPVSSKRRELGIIAGVK